MVCINNTCTTIMSTFTYYDRQLLCQCDNGIKMCIRMNVTQTRYEWKKDVFVDSIIDAILGLEYLSSNNP